MINRICISINNRCNLACRYCHFREKGEIEAAEMNVFAILDNVKEYATQKFKIGFVGNGRIDAFELWCWRRPLRVPWTARRSTSPRDSLESSPTSH